MTDDTTILVDVLTIVLTIVGISIGGGYFAIYTSLSRKLQSETEAKANATILHQVSELLNHMSYIYWLDYQESKSSFVYLQSAISLAERALEITNALDGEHTDKIKCKIKNNLAYYLAAAHGTPIQRGGDERVARDCARDIYDKISRYTELRDSWTDTYNYVKKVFP